MKTLGAVLIILFVIVGFFAYCLCAISGKSDENMDKIFREKS